VTPVTPVTVSDASPLDESEKLKARHAAEIDRIVEVAQETVEKLVQEALEDVDRRIDEPKADHTIASSPTICTRPHGFRTRACLHSSCPEHDGDEVDHRRETCIGFFVARRDASKHLDIAEEVFDEVTPLVLFLVMREMSGGTLAHRDHSLDGSATQIFA
jgi:hypothetical protein